MYTEEKAKVVAVDWEDKIGSIPCRTTDLAPGLFVEMNEKKNGHLAEWMFWKNG